MEKKARKTGLDILKIFSMIFVIIYHITLYGVDLVNIQQYSMPYWMITGLKCVSIVSVNCFILVTGFFLSKSHVNYKKIDRIMDTSRNVLSWGISVLMYDSGNRN